MMVDTQTQPLTLHRALLAAIGKLHNSSISLSTSYAEQNEHLDGISTKLLL